MGYKDELQDTRDHHEEVEPVKQGHHVTLQRIIDQEYWKYFYKGTVTEDFLICDLLRHASFTIVVTLCGSNASSIYLHLQCRYIFVNVA